MINNSPKCVRSCNIEENCLALQTAIFEKKHFEFYVYEQIFEIYFERRSDTYGLVVGCSFVYFV